MVAAFHALPLAAMFLVVATLSAAVVWAEIAAIRAYLRLRRLPIRTAAPIKDSIVGACATVFGLMVTFSAAGIWNDASRASAAVQRETDALENAMALARAFPAAQRARSTSTLSGYVDAVVVSDWPAMRKGVVADSPVYARAERLLLAEIAAAAGDVATGGDATLQRSYLSALLDARGARMTRLLVAGSGMSRAQWLAAIIAAAVTALAIALSNNASAHGQIFATHAFALVASCVFFAILAHDMPFAGAIAVTPNPYLALIAK